MTLPGDVPRPPAKRLPDTMVEAILSHLEQYDEATVRSAVQNALEVSRPVEVVDLWKRQEAATTYWILLLTGVNQEDEMRVAKDLLTWQAFFAKDSARVLCVQSSERDAFRCCAKAFAVHNFPTLFLSDSPDMIDRIEIPPDLLLSLAERPGGLQQFLAKTHSVVETGKTMTDIRDDMYAEAFWRGIGVVYREIKDLLSITVSTGSQ
jgi:hypothetical protein